MLSAATGLLVGQYRQPLGGVGLTRQGIAGAIESIEHQNAPTQAARVERPDFARHQSLR
jgi:hypothetical protein